VKKLASKVVEVVTSKTEQYLENSDMELVDVEFVKEGPHRYLRVIIDKEDGITIEDCQELSKFLNKALDGKDIVKERYYLEVTSPGIERELKDDEDFAKFKGEKVTVKLYHPINGMKKFVGVLKGFSESYLVVIKDEEEIKVPKNKIAQVKLYHEF
jgi:ribosome maturation factor RimP